MGLASNIITKIRGRLPDGASRYSDAFLQRRIYNADCEIKEAGELLWDTHDISLIADVHHYNLPTNMVAIDTVLYSTDGTTFDDGELEPSTIHDFHNDHYKWSELRGVEPGYYALLGCPGASGSKIVVYPALSTVTSNAIRVRYLRCRAEAGTNFLADTVQGWVEDEVYIPHVMAQLHAQRDKRLFRRYWAEYLINVNKLRGASRSRYGETKDSIGAFGDYPASGGQL